LETRYRLKSLDGAGQMIKITKSDNKTFLNNQIKVMPNPGTAASPLTSHF